jgi:L-2,4-diaminobutyric acid acetyltransferase
MNNPNPKSSVTDDVNFRSPQADDGLEIHRLIADSPPLDLNSVYAYYLLCTHFSETCVVAEQGGELLGFISAYRLPRRADTLFVWQVAVCSSARGRGIARRMLDRLLDRLRDEELRYLEVTVNPSNAASRGLFERLARSRGTVLQEDRFLDTDAFGSSSAHEPEILLRIPLTK